MRNSNSVSTEATAVPRRFIVLDIRKFDKFSILLFRLLVYQIYVTKNDGCFVFISFQNRGKVNVILSLYGNKSIFLAC